MPSSEVPSKLKQRAKIAPLAGATSQMQIKSATLGTTAKGMPAAIEDYGGRRNYNGTGPQPQRVNNAQISFRKKSTL
jgi:hypothetical protein